MKENLLKLGHNGLELLIHLQVLYFFTYIEKVGQHAKKFYELINYDPMIRTIKQAENLKVSENQWTALIRAIRNVEAYFVERIGTGNFFISWNI